jgi:hypothetical protein
LGIFNPPNPANLLSSLAMSSAPVSLGDAFAGAASYRPPQWIAVRQRFTQFHQNLLLTPAQRTDGMTKRAGVVSCLNSAYYSSNSQTDNSFFVGSWGKDTGVRPPRDVDVYFLLPPAVYNRFQGYIWNRQSALLQEVKNRLIAAYPATDMSGDGQVVVVNFGSYAQPICQLVNGGPVDEAIGQLLVNAVTPVTLEMGLAVQKELESRCDESDRLRRQEVERARYEADLARRRFMRRSWK